MYVRSVVYKKKKISIIKNIENLKSKSNEKSILKIIDPSNRAILSNSDTLRLYCSSSTVYDVTTISRIVNLDSTSWEKEFGGKTVIQRVKIAGATRPLTSSSVGIAIGSLTMAQDDCWANGVPCRLAGRFEIQSTSGPCCKIVNRIPRSLPRLAVVAVVTRVGQFLSVFPGNGSPFVARCCTRGSDSSP